MPVPLQTRAPQTATVYYQMTNEIDSGRSQCGYLSLPFHRSNPLAPGALHPILDECTPPENTAAAYLRRGL